MWKATLGVLCPVLVFPAQRETGETGDSPVESHRVSEETAACLMRELGLHHLADSLTVNTRTEPSQGRARFESPAEKQRLRRLEGDTVWPDSAFATPACSSCCSCCRDSCIQPLPPAALHLQPLHPGQELHPWSSRELWGLHSRVPHATERPLCLEGVEVPKFAFGLADDPKPSSASASDDCPRTHRP